MISGSVAVSLVLWTQRAHWIHVLNMLNIMEKNPTVLLWRCTFWDTWFQGRSYIEANEANASLKFQNIKKGQTVSANKKKRLNVQKKLLVQMSHGLFQSSKCWAILDIWTSNVLASNMSKSWTHGAGPVRQM